MNLKKIWNGLVRLLEDDDPPGEIVYDPVHVGGVIVGVIAGFGVLYWLLWALLVCEGGLLTKIIPFLQVVLTSKTLGDFGYIGYPYELGIFEGWIVNMAALVLGLGLVAGIWWVLEGRSPRRKRDSR